jgi:2-polyprenyl-3-methyl-5-hydroxy-6-metoxy-1,4-benzoquinol methylase
MSDLETYSDYFYESQLIQSKKSANQILPIIEDWFSPSSIIDVGCGVGAWLEQWKQINPEKEVTGYDADFVNESLLLIKPEEFVTTDLNETIKSSSKAELLMCLEVAEHLNEKRADSFISDLTSLSDVILFSAAIPGQEGTHHINE